MRKLLLFLFVSIVLFACQTHQGDIGDDQEKDSVLVDSTDLEELDLYEEVVIPESADQLFDDFFYTFINDVSFQKERTDKGVEFDATQRGSAENAFVVVYERDEDLVLQKDTTLDRVGVELINWNDDGVRKYIFNRVSGKWRLTEVKEDEMNNSPNASFYVFLKDFLTDSLYCRESIKFPLELQIYSYEDEEIIDTSLDWEDWKALCSELPDMRQAMLNVDYGQTLISQNRKAIQLKSLNNNTSIIFYFVFNDNRWQLMRLRS